MTTEQKLAQIFQALGDGGVDALVMGGHAVRYYGIDRNTIDFDLVTSIATPDELRSKLPTIPLLAASRPEPVWRRRDFARFEIGRLPDGREEWLEFWLRNHLLSDFESLKARAEVGIYGGGSVAFLSIPDLIKSKETERESDWQDIALLEEVLDERHFARLDDSPDSVVRILANLRSRRGMDRAVSQDLLKTRQNVIESLHLATHPATVAFLMPVTADAQGELTARLEPAVREPLMTATVGSARHFGLIEVCRRTYKRHAMARDRADKQVQLGASRVE